MAGNLGIFGNGNTGGSSIFTNKWTDTPSANKIGDIWFCSDALYYDYFIWTGVKWQAYIHGKPVNIPSRDFRWTPYSGGNIDLSVPYISSGRRVINNINYSTPAWAVGAFIPIWGRTQYQDFSVNIRSSSAGTNVSISVSSYNNAGIGVPQMYASKYNSSWGWIETYQIEQCSSYFLGTDLVWLRMYDNGTTRYSQFSADGINWQTFHSIGRTDYLTGNQFGFTLNGGILVHWDRYPIMY